MKKSLVGILMGSDSDLEIMSQAAKILDEIKIPNEILILSTHRVPQETADWAKNAQANGFKVIIAGAGGAAALPGSLASLTLLPVIGVPIESKTLQGLDSLLSIIQMPSGVPVATVGINSAKNAGILAAEIIGLTDPQVQQRLSEYKSNLKNEVLTKNSKLQKIGSFKYLKQLKK